MEVMNLGDGIVNFICIIRQILILYKITIYLRGLLQLWRLLRLGLTPKNQDEPEKTLLTEGILIFF
ncbi:MAG: hypothetical protein ACJAYJ_003810 [Saprospiraceae bacterium]|jgi:hypothetical protein